MAAGRKGVLARAGSQLVTLNPPSGGIELTAGLQGLNVFLSDVLPPGMIHLLMEPKPFQAAPPAGDQGLNQMKQWGMLITQTIHTVGCKALWRLTISGHIIWTLGGKTGTQFLILWLFVTILQRKIIFSKDKEVAISPDPAPNVGCPHLGSERCPFLCRPPPHAPISCSCVLPSVTLLLSALCSLINTVTKGHLGKKGFISS